MFAKIINGLKEEEQDDDIFQSTPLCKHLYTPSKLSNAPLMKKFAELSEDVEEYRTTCKKMRAKYFVYKESSDAKLLLKDMITSEWKKEIEKQEWYVEFSKDCETLSQIIEERKNLMEEINQSESEVTVDSKLLCKRFEVKKDSILKSIGKQEQIMIALKNICEERYSHKEFLLKVNVAFNNFNEHLENSLSIIKTFERFLETAQTCFRKVMIVVDKRRSTKEKHLSYLKNKISPPSSLLPTSLKTIDNEVLVNDILCLKFGIRDKKVEKQNKKQSSMHHLKIKHRKKEHVELIEEEMKNLGSKHKIIFNDFVTYVFKDEGAAHEAYAVAKDILGSDTGIIMKIKEEFEI